MNRAKIIRLKTARTQKHDVRYIVIHKSCTRSSMPVRNLDKLPYHFVVTRGGRALNLKPISPREGTVEIAYLGGVDRQGKHLDTRTEAQSAALFNALVMLCDGFPDAKVVGADEVYVYPYANPGFDIKEWLREYIPAFLLAA